MSQWKDNVAVITGAASGIGSGLSRYAASHGMHVVVADVATQRLDALSETLGAKEEMLNQKYAGQNHDN